MSSEKVLRTHSCASGHRQAPSRNGLPHMALRGLTGDPKGQRVPAALDPAGRGMQNRWRQDNIGRRLNEAVRRFDGHIMELMKEQGYTSLSLSQLSVTRNLDDHGTRLTELARRVGIAKQSMAELALQVEGLGLIERRQDPNDKRARLIFFTEAGFQWLEVFHQCLLTVESEMRAKIGDAVVDYINDGLARYNLPLSSS